MPTADQETGRAPSRESIEVAFARFEGAVSTDLKNIAHDVKGVLQSLALYATKSDLRAAEERLDAKREAEVVSAEARREAVRERIDRIEKGQTWVVRTIAAAALGALISGAGYLISLVLKVAHP